MPHKLAKPCKYAGCKNLTHDFYCDEHKKASNKEYNTYQRHYTDFDYNSKAWRQIRQIKLSIDPICEKCQRVKATMVDHILAIKNGGDPFNLNNLQSLCWSCHTSKTNKEKKNTVFTAPYNRG